MLGDASFQNGLRSRGESYLDDLLERALLDYELESDSDTLRSSFRLLKRFIRFKGASVMDTLTLADLERFELETDVIQRLGYVAQSMMSGGEEEYEQDDYEDDEFEVVEDIAECSDTVRLSLNKPERAESKSTLDTSSTILVKPINSGGYSSHRDSKQDFYILRSERKDSGSYYNSSRGGSDTEKTDSSMYMDEEKIRPITAQSTALPLSSRSSSGLSPAASSRSVTSSTLGLRKSKQSAAINWIASRQWRLGEKIGSGSFGDVYMGLNNKGKLFAVKKMNIKDKSTEVNDLISEIQMMRGLQHVNIVEYVGALVDTVECTVYIFQEWVPGGSVAHLLKKFGPFPLDTVQNYTRQILRGLHYLHCNHIIHRDIKGGNILVDDVGIVKLADFGASTNFSTFDRTQETTTIKGTPYFMAPEVLASSKYGRKGDIWAVGCTMIQMLTGEPPWKDQNLKGLVQLHLLLQNWNKGPPPFQSPSKLTPEADECLNLCFRKDPNERPRAVELLQCSFLLEDEDCEDYISGKDAMRMNSNFEDEDEGGLEDSGVISGLKLEMAKAISMSKGGGVNVPPKPPPISSSNISHGTPRSYSGDTTGGRSEETIAAIDRKMRGGGGITPTHQPPLTPPTPPLEKPKYSVDIPLPVPNSSVYSVGNSSSDSQGAAYPVVNTNLSRNPFSRGVISLKGNTPRTTSSISSSNDQNISRKYTSSSESSTPTSRGDAYSEEAHIGKEAKPYLTLLKTKNTNNPRIVAPTRRGSNSSNESANHVDKQTSQSSNRDSEDLTPLSQDDSDGEYSEQPQQIKQSGSARSKQHYSHHMVAASTVNKKGKDDMQEPEELIIITPPAHNDANLAKVGPFQKSSSQPSLVNYNSSTRAPPSSFSTTSQTNIKDNRHTRHKMSDPVVASGWTCPKCKTLNMNPAYCVHCNVPKAAAPGIRKSSSSSGGRL